MKKIAIFILALSSFSCEKNDISDDTKTEISIFDKNGEAEVYYVSPDDEQVVYLWDGRPSSYIVTSDEVIYGFNGKFLGWYESGIIYDLEGNRGWIQVINATLVRSSIFLAKISFGV